MLQEDILKAGPVPYSIVRATQFFEFIDAVLSWTSDEHTVRLPATPIQPMAAADVAQAVADVSVGAPLQGTRNVAGPEVFALDELGRITLAARGDQRTVVTDDSAGMFAAAPGDALIAKDGAVIAKTTYREWLAFDSRASGSGDGDHWAVRLGRAARAVEDDPVRAGQRHPPDEQVVGRGHQRVRSTGVQCSSVFI